MLYKLYDDSHNGKYENSSDLSPPIGPNFLTQMVRTSDFTSNATIFPSQPIIANSKEKKVGCKNLRMVNYLSCKPKKSLTNFKLR